MPQLGLLMGSIWTETLHEEWRLGSERGPEGLPLELEAVGDQKKRVSPTYLWPAHPQLCPQVH
jgi:hypothetical protein